MGAIKAKGVPGARVGARGARVEGIQVTVLRKGCRSKRQPSYHTAFRVFERNVEVIEKALQSGIFDYNGILYRVRGWDKEFAYAPPGPGWGTAYRFDVDLVEWNQSPAEYVSSRGKSPPSMLDKVLHGEVDLG